MEVFRQTVGDKTHNKSYEYQPKHSPHQIKKGEKKDPDKDNPIDSGEFIDAKSHGLSNKEVAAKEGLPLLSG
jgi:hypothetical protein